MRPIPALLLITVLPLAAQQLDDPAETGSGGAVPLPTDVDFMDTDSLEPPKSVELTFESGADYDKDTEVLTSRGWVSAIGDNGMTLNADKGRYEGKTKLLKVDGSVKLTTGNGEEVFADHGVLDDTTRTITFTGNVTVYQQQMVQHGHSVVYYMDTKKIDGDGLRTGVDPILLEAGAFVSEERDGKRVFVGQDAGITTHDVEEPAVWIRANETTVYPDDRVVFKNMKLYAGDVPIFWLPYLSQPLDAELGYHFTPGARSNWGPFLLNRYGIMLGRGTNGTQPWLLSRWHFDLREKRGLAGGIDLVDRRLEDNPNMTGFSLYYANDLDPSISRNGQPRPFVNEDRWRIALQHRIDLPFEDGDQWRLDANLTALSDNFFLEDFDPRTFRTDPNPDNTIALFRRDDHSLFGFTTRVRPNDFYRSETRIPEITFDQSRRRLFDTPFLHEGHTSFSVIDEQIGSFSEDSLRAALALPAGDPRRLAFVNRLPNYERQLANTIFALPAGSPLIPSLATQLYNPGYTRFHTYQEFSTQTKVAGWLNLTPELGIGYSDYSSVHGPQNSLSRLHFYTGAEASTKFSRDYGEFVSRKWGLDGLMHIFQPYATFSFVNTDDLNPLFPSVDRETFTTRPRTLSPSRFTAIDSLRDWSILRLGMRNHLITRRDKGNFEWLYIDTYMDGFFDDPEALDRDFSNLYNDVTWVPLDWLRLRLETQIPVIDNGAGFTEIATNFEFMPTENFEFSIGNRVLDNHPFFQDSNRVNLRAYWRINDKWGVRGYHSWELDDGILEFQEYSIHRDFKHLVGSLGFMTRDNRIDNEYGVLLSIALKDFPTAELPFSFDAQ